MERYTEATVSDFLRLMTDYLESKIDVQEYRKRIFDAMKRGISTGESEYQILQTAYGDADDFDAEIRLEYTIEEPELRRRVTKSIEELALLGYSPGV